MDTATLASNAHAVRTIPTTVTATSVTFPDSSEVDGFAVGDVIASATRLDTPYLMTITSIQHGNGQVTFQTTPALLTDLFKEVHFAQTMNLGNPNVLDNSQSYRLGDLHTDGLTGPALGADKKWKLPGGAGSVSIGASGTCDMSESYLDLQGGVEFNFDYSSASGVSDFKLALQGSLTADLGVKGSITGKASYTSPPSYWLKETSFATFWFQVGVVPVPVVATVSLAQTVTVALQAQLQFHEATIAAISIEEGAEYQNGSWSAIDNRSANLTETPFSITGGTGTVSVSYSPVGATFALKPFNLAGPTLSLSPYIGISGKYGSAGAEIDGKLGVKASIGGEVVILGKNLGAFSYPLADLSAPPFVLYKAPAMCELTGEAGALSGAWCNEAALRSCVTGLSSAGCFNQSGTCSTAGNAQGPANEDVVCNAASLLKCLCEAAAGDAGGAVGGDDGGSDAGSGDDNGGDGGSDDGGDGGDCFSQHCSPCAQADLVCTVPG